jgi:hypothetical protein
MRRFPIKALLLVGTSAFAAPTFAQSCGGFVDVPAGEFYCANTQWLKNRGVTLGCTDAMHYCPNDFVPRSQMAAFMARLGTVLTPHVQRVEQDVGLLAVVLGGNSTVFCQTPAYAPTAYPRTAYMVGAMNASLSLGLSPLSFNLELVISNDGGATWLNVGAIPNAIRLPAVALGVNASVTGLSLIDAGESFQMGVRAESATVATVMANAACSLVTVVQSRDGTSPPF